MADLLALSERVIDHGEYEGQNSVNRITTELSEVADGIAVVEAFSHVVAFRTGEGLVLFDTSLDALAPACLASLRQWSDDPVRAIVYTHGHRDHAAGTRTYLDEADARADARPEIVGHENVAARFDRYELTDGYNAVINARQFGDRLGRRGQAAGTFFDDWVRPDRTYRLEDTVTYGDSTFDLHHGKGETDDHTWTWVPEHRAVVAGDFFIWVFPNAGNPQKAQRYPREWAEALRAMAATEPELFLPAHGLPIGGQGPHPAAPAGRGRHPRPARGRRAGPDERGRAAGHDRPRGPGAPGRARPAVDAARLRRAGVRGPQHLAPVRRVVRRQPGPPEAPGRRRRRR